MKHLKLMKNILVSLLGFLSIGAFYGGILLIIKPDCSFFDIPIDILQNSPFKTSLYPE